MEQTLRVRPVLVASRKRRIGGLDVTSSLVQGQGDYSLTALGQRDVDRDRDRDRDKDKAETDGFAERFVSASMDKGGWKKGSGADDEDDDDAEL